MEISQFHNVIGTPPLYNTHTHRQVAWDGVVLASTHEVGPWKMVFFHGPSFIVQFLRKLVYKAFGKLGVNQMWTKRNDHAPKVNVPTKNLIQN